MTAHGSETDRARYFASLTPLGLAPLWSSLSNLLLPAPATVAVPHVWRYEDVRPKLMEAGDLVTAQEAERRVLVLENPALVGESSATENLYAGMQLVLPGEVAPPHRHTQSALRFIVEGDGGYSTVNGERLMMHRGDMILTPSWSSHDHGNEGSGPVIWLDGLDIPIVNPLRATFFETLGHDPLPVVHPLNSSSRSMAVGRLNPHTLRGWQHPHSPLVSYPWVQTEAALHGAAEVGNDSAHDGVILEYANPANGGSVLPTMACHIQLLRSGISTAAHRHTSSAVYHVVSGTGVTVIDGTPFHWGTNDTFAVPTWAVHRHECGDGEPAVLFSFTDEPLYRALGLYREQPVEG